MSEYGFSCTVDGALSAVRPRVEAALKGEGFGVLTEIDVQATLKKKLDKDIRPYVILGACNPPLASQAIEAEADVGLLLPCNVLLQEVDGVTKVSFLNPAIMKQVVPEGRLDALATEAEARLRRVCASLA